MNRILFATLTALPLFVGTAFAQGTAPTNPPAAQPANPPATTTMPSNQTTAPATAPSNRADAVAAQGPFLGTQLWKQGVYDTSDNRIGEIDNLVISQTGQIQEVVVGVGGFLGLGEKSVALPYTSLKPMLRNNQIWFVVNQTKEQLNSAPTFDATKYKR